MTLLLMAGLDFDQSAIKDDRHCDEARRIAVNIAKLPELLSRRHVPEQANRINGTQSDGRCRLLFQEDKMSESEFVRDLVQQGVRQAMQLEALKNIRLLINTAWFAIIVTPVVLTLILWRVW